MALTFRWLGTAGLEFTLDGTVLLIDPFFTRPGKLALLAPARAASNEALAARYAPQADAILVTHPHYDHLLDVPAILKRTGAPAYGSPHACALLRWSGISPAQARCIRPGDCLELGPFRVEVFPAWHTPIPFGRLLDRRLDVEAPPRRPLRLSDFRMDACYSFHIRAGNADLLVGNHPVSAGLLYLSPFYPPERLEAVLRAIRPRRVIPIHWDDFTRPLSRPLLPMWATPAQGLRPRFPPLRRLDLAAFSGAVRAVLPSVEVTLPEIFRLEILA